MAKMQLKMILNSLGLAGLMSFGAMCGWWMTAKGWLAPAKLMPPSLVTTLGLEAASESSADPHAHDHADDHSDDHAGDAAGMAEEKIVAMSKQAYKSLRMEIDYVQHSTHWKTLNLPGQVIEIPGFSNVALAAPVDGIVSKIYANQGQAVAPGDLLFELQITDDALMSAQLTLLEAITQGDIVAKELERLKPLVAGGAVAGRRSLELQYDQNKFSAQRQNRIQELQLRGLSVAQIDGIITKRDLVKTLAVRLPLDLAPSQDFGLVPVTVPTPQDPSADKGDSDRLPPPKGKPIASMAGGRAIQDQREFSVEDLNVFPGKAVKRGDDLCQLAYHSQLFVRGEAFQSDVDAILNLKKNAWLVQVEFGHTIESPDLAHRQEGRVDSEELEVLYIDNHVDKGTQSFLFYMPLANQVSQDSVGTGGKVFRQWKFKPGERTHVMIPVEKFSDQIVLPIDATVQDGLETLVFRKHVHVHAADEAHVHSGNEPFIEFEPVPVQVLQRDDRSVVIAAGGDLQVDDIVAMNNAYHLNMELKSGNAPAHSHDH